MSCARVEQALFGVSVRSTTVAEIAGGEQVGPFEALSLKEMPVLAVIDPNLTLKQGTLAQVALLEEVQVQRADNVLAATASAFGASG